MMFKFRSDRIRGSKALLIMFVLLALLVPTSSFAGKKKKQAAPAKPAEAPKPQIDVTKLVWPGPPSIPRVRYVGYFAGQKIDTTPASEQPKAKSSWMDRLAGTEPANRKGALKPLPFQLLGPFGMAVNSKGCLLYTSPSPRD